MLLSAHPRLVRAKVSTVSRPAQFAGDGVCVGRNGTIPAVTATLPCRAVPLVKESCTKKTTRLLRLVQLLPFV
jgi:hypothetical protein